MGCQRVSAPAFAPAELERRAILTMIEAFFDPKRALPRNPKGDTILVFNRFVYASRIPWAHALGEMRTRERERSKGSRTMLDELAESTMPATFNIPPIPSLKEMSLGNRVVVTDYFVPDSANSVKPERVRVRLMVQPVTYSPDGKYAIVRAGASTFIHATGVDFLLRRNAEGWDVALLQVTP